MRRLTVTAVAALALAGLVVAPIATAKIRFFQTPSKNIACDVFGGNKAVPGAARCDIAVRNWTAPPKPASCQLDYGNGLEVGIHGKGHYLCSGDTDLGQGKVLAFGNSVTVGRFTCRSSHAGVRCVNTRNGHGFSISRQFAKRF